MNPVGKPTLIGVVLALVPFAGAGVKFEKRVLSDEYFADGVNAGDFNRDGHPDVVAGPYWYAGPVFKERHAFYPPFPLPPEEAPSNSMFSFAYDFNGDGWEDILVLGRVLHHEAFWYENPRGAPGPWPKHFVFHRVMGESPPFLDIDGDGRPEIVTHWEGRWGLLAPNWSNPTEPWQFRPITEAGKWKEYYHGTGAGDINGDGRMDLLLNDGWWEQPAEAGKPWIPHRFVFSDDRGGAQMFAYDIDGDGDNDVVTSLNSHEWGLAWFEQRRARDGTATFHEHRMMGDRSEEAKYGVAFSQPHALEVADLDGDGLRDVIVGKRRWAHGPTGDVEPMAPPVIYWFQLKRDPAAGAVFVPHLMDDWSGVGTQIAVTDVNGDQVPDVLAASKLGAFVFLTRQASSSDGAAETPGSN